MLSIPATANQFPNSMHFTPEILLPSIMFFHFHYCSLDQWNLFQHCFRPTNSSSHSNHYSEKWIHNNAFPFLCLRVKCELLMNGGCDLPQSWTLPPLSWLFSAYYSLHLTKIQSVFQICQCTMSSIISSPWNVEVQGWALRLDKTKFYYLFYSLLSVIFSKLFFWASISTSNYHF